MCYCGSKQPGAVAWISCPPTPCSHPATLAPPMRPSWGQSWGSRWGRLTPCSRKPGVFCFSSNPITTIRLPRLEYVCSPHCSLVAISQRGFKFNWLYSNTTPTHNMLVPLGFRKPTPPHKFILSVLSASTYTCVYVGMCSLYIHLFFLEGHVNCVKQLSHSNMLHSRGNKVI